ncbi:hypothetical protein [Pseudolactococcus piscium]|uniref:hypothetical protein n=1 Tax=Pseudolactococcus piscium TaxID=1364 RepID=UPI000BDF5954|nr:hypothetical protein [Lactococcus piscium]
MSNNICKIKQCEREIQAGEEYCHHHKKKHSEKNGNIIKGILGLIGIVVMGIITREKIDNNK